MPICPPRDLGELDIGSFSIAPTYQVFRRTFPLGPPDEGVEFAVSHLPHCFVQCSHNVSKLCSFLPHNLSGMKKSNLFRKSVEGNISHRLMRKSCWEHNCGCTRNIEVSHTTSFLIWPSVRPERNPSTCSLDKTTVFFRNVFVSSLQHLFSKDSLDILYQWCLTLLSCREEDEYSELRSELSQSQQEVNEDSRSMDQDQTSVSIPENQSTMVTADMGESSQAAGQAGLWLLGCKKNIRNTRQSELIFHYSRSLGSGWKHIHFNPVFTALLATVN